jgi:dTDP-4-amino-4,6-dideoxy-D-galactose acyltransferase
MDITQLKWDTDFFGYKVGTISLNDNNLDENLLLNNDFKLIYLFSKESLSEDLVKKHNLFLSDEKIDLILNVSNLNFNNFENENLVELTKLDDNLLDLTFQSGHFSRFKIDSNFKNNEFERLYTAWIEQSITHKNADKVIGFLINNKVVGFITFVLKNNMFDIGLIAVSEQHRSLKIGKQLLAYVFNYSVSKNVDFVTVTTQNNNQGALNFYLKNGFSINQTTYIYHMWK